MLFWLDKCTRDNIINSHPVCNISDTRLTMILRRSDERYLDNMGLITERYSFSFSNYFDPCWTGFRTLRVLNETHIAPDGGFPLHPHKNMEVITFVTSGQYHHVTSNGDEATLQAGQFQVISAGEGVYHSADNPGPGDTHLWQIWIEPTEKGGTPLYKDFTPDFSEKWGLVASSDGTDNSVQIRQHIDLYAFSSTQNRQVMLPKKRPYSNLWLQVVRGGVILTPSLRLNSGDGIGLSVNEIPEYLKLTKNTQILVFLFS